MSLTRGRSPGFFAIIICLFVSLGTASAWMSICVPGDIYLDSTGRAPLPAGTTCTYCTDWCDAQCSILGLPQVDYGCRLETNNDIKCRCCCGSSPPSPSPSSPPSLPRPPPAPQAESEFHGGYPHEYNICTTGQTYLVLVHTNGTECVRESKCEQGCKDVKLSMARKECVAGGYTYPPPATYTWREQCCCETPSPPPPSPPPPPPQCTPSCPTEFTMQLRGGQKPCKYVLSPGPSVSASSHGDFASLLFPAIYSE